MFILNAIMMILIAVITSNVPTWVRIVALVIFALLAIIGNEWYRFTLSNVDISLGFVYGEIQKIKKHLNLPLDKEINDCVGWVDEDEDDTD